MRPDRGGQALRLNTGGEKQAHNEGVGRKEIVLHEFLLGSWQCLQLIKHALGRNLFRQPAKNCLACFPMQVLMCFLLPASSVDKARGRANGDVGFAFLLVPDSLPVGIARIDNQ